VFGDFLWVGRVYLACLHDLKLLVNPPPRAIDSLAIAHSPVSTELYRLWLFLEDLTAEGAEGAEKEMREVDHSDFKGFDFSGRSI
jgi:hypothetical protein